VFEPHKPVDIQSVNLLAENVEKLQGAGPDPLRTFFFTLSGAQVVFSKLRKFLRRFSEANSQRSANGKKERTWKQTRLTKSVLQATCMKI
jgi:hypothetical protein